MSAFAREEGTRIRPANAGNLYFEFHLLAAGRAVHINHRTRPSDVNGWELLCFRRTHPYLCAIKLSWATRLPQSFIFLPIA